MRIKHGAIALALVAFAGVGAWVAWGVFRTFGLAGFLMPLLLAVWGLMMVFQSGERVWPRVLWMVGILSGVCVLVIPASLPRSDGAGFGAGRDRHTHGAAPLGP